MYLNEYKLPIHLHLQYLVQHLLTLKSHHKAKYWLKHMKGYTVALQLAKQLYIFVLILRFRAS